MTNGASNGLVLRWCIVGGSWYEYACQDSTIAGKLYNIRCQDEHVVTVQLWHGDVMVLQYNKPQD